MKKNRSIVIGVLVLGVGLLAYQNCSVRRLEGTGLSSVGGAHLSGDGQPAGGGGTGGNGGSNASACLLQDPTNGTIIGLTGQPSIKSSFAMVTRMAAQGQFVPASTSLSLMAMSDCASETAMANPGKCPTPSPTPSTCQSKKSFNVSITLACDKASNTSTTCTRFASMLNQEIDLTNATYGNDITISVQNVTDSCNATAGSASYLPGFGANRKGKIKITSSSTSLADGTVYSVQLIGVEALKGATDTANKITLDGTYSGKIISIKQCTP